MGNVCFSRRDHVAVETFTPPSAPSTAPSGSSATTSSTSKSGVRLIGVRAGDRLCLLPRPAGLNDEQKVQFDEAVFHYVRNRRTKEAGFVHHLFVAENKFPERERWYFGDLDRRKAEHILLSECNVSGAYLVRKSARDPNAFALSLKYFDEEQRKFACRNYIIQHQDGTYFLTPRQKFLSLTEFISACENSALEGIRGRLTSVCQRPQPTINVIGAETGGKWDIASQDIQKLEKLGGGHYGNVYKGMWRGCIEVALKELKSDTGEAISAAAKTDFEQESRILQRLHHPHLVQVFGVSTDTSPLMMVLELLPVGDLREFVVKNKDTVTCDKLINICGDIASGMNKLVSEKIVHRDLAARNVMLDRWHQAKVGDFGLARVMDEYGTEQEAGAKHKSKAKLPFKWTAPEGIRSRHFTHKSDVWSFGVVLWETFTFGLVPYPELSNREMLDVLDRGERLPKPEFAKAAVKSRGFERKYTDALHTIMTNCWKMNPDQRPQFCALQDDFRDFESAVVYYQPVAGNAAANGANAHESNSNRRRKKEARPGAERRRAQ